MMKSASKGILFFSEMLHSRIYNCANTWTSETETNFMWSFRQRADSGHNPHMFNPDLPTSNDAARVSANDIFHWFSWFVFGRKIWCRYWSIRAETSARHTSVRCTRGLHDKACKNQLTKMKVNQQNFPMQANLTYMESDTGSSSRSKIFLEIPSSLFFWEFSTNGCPSLLFCWHVLSETSNFS